MMLGAPGLRVPCNEHKLLALLIDNSPEVKDLVVHLTHTSDFTETNRRNEQEIIAFQEVVQAALSNNDQIRTVHIPLVRLRRDGNPSFLMQCQVAELNMLVHSFNKYSKLHTVSARMDDVAPEIMEIFSRLCCLDSVDKVTLIGETHPQQCVIIGNAICHARDEPLGELTLSTRDVGIRELSQPFLVSKKHVLLPKKLYIEKSHRTNDPYSTAIISPAISGMLGGDCSSIKEFCFGGRVSDTHKFITSVSASLKKNNTLRKLIFPRLILQSNDWSDLLSCVCNKTSMQSTYQSNHCLREILTAQTQSNGNEICVKNNDLETAKYLTLNAHQNEKRIRRLKVVACYFSDDFNLTQFKDTNANVIIAIGKFIQKTKIHHRGWKKKRRSTKQHSHTFTNLFMMESI